MRLGPFDDVNMQVVVQVNSSHNWYRATGQNINAIIREAYENAYQSPKATEYEYPLNILFRRKQDGFVVSRGVKNNGSFGRRNFDRDWTSGWTHFRTFEAGGQFYALNYKADLGNGFGRGHMREVNPDGTLGDDVFNQENWRAGWTHLDFFERLGTDFLLLFNENDQRLRIYQMNNDGTLQLPAVVNTAEAAYDILKVVGVAGQDKLFRHNSATGETVLHSFNPDGSISTPANYMGRWETGFNDFQFYRSDGKLFLCRYAHGNGKIRINELIGAQFQSRPERYDASDWSSGWGIFRFFTIQGRTFNYRYNPEKGVARLQAMKNDGTFDFESEYKETDELLRTIAPQGEFHPGFTGWTEIEFYESTTTPATVPPIISLAPGDTNGNERDNKGAGIAHARYFRPASARISEPKIQIDLNANSLFLNWMGLPETVDLAEVSTNLLEWRGHSFHLNEVTASTPNFVEIPRPRGEETGKSLFTRVRRFGLPEPDEPEIGPVNTGPRLR